MLCPVCSTIMRESHCELQCPRCHYIEDCGDGCVPQYGDGGVTAARDGAVRTAARQSPSRTGSESQSSSIHDGGVTRSPRRSHTPETPGLDSPAPPPLSMGGFGGYLKGTAGLATAAADSPLQPVTVAPMDVSIYPRSPRCTHQYLTPGWGPRHCLWCNAPEVAPR